MQLVQYMFRLALENSALTSPVTSYKARSTLECARFCTNQCRSYSFKKSEQQCLLSNDIYEEGDPQIQAQSGWKYHVAVPASTPVPASCPVPYRRLTDANLCVNIVTTPELDLAETNTACGADGGRLLQLDTRMKIDAFKTFHISDYSNIPMRIGLVDSSTGGFKWQDGRTLTISDWADGHPLTNDNQDSVVIEVDASPTYSWETTFSLGTYPYVCEIPQ